MAIIVVSLCFLSFRTEKEEIVLYDELPIQIVEEQEEMEDVPLEYESFGEEQQVEEQEENSEFVAQSEVQPSVETQEMIEAQSLGDPQSLFTGAHLFITTRRTTTANEQIQIPTASSTSPQYNFDIDRGDGTTGHYGPIANPNPTHMYTTP